MYVAVPKTGGHNQTFAVKNSRPAWDFDFGVWSKANNTALTYKDCPIFDWRLSWGRVDLCVYQSKIRAATGQARKQYQAKKTSKDSTDTHASNIRAANRRRQGMIDQLKREAKCSWRNISIALVTGGSSRSSLVSLLFDKLANPTAQRTAAEHAESGSVLPACIPKKMAPACSADAKSVSSLDSTLMRTTFCDFGAEPSPWSLLHRYHNLCGLLHPAGTPGHCHRVGALRCSRPRYDSTASTTGRLQQATGDEQHGDPEPEEFSAIRTADPSRAETNARNEKGQQEQRLRS